MPPIKVTVLGAAGKMGTRISNALREESAYAVLHVEADAQAEQALTDRGDVPRSFDDAVKQGGIVILAVPDRFIKTIAPQAVKAMSAGAMLVCLDPAAPHAGLIPPREDIGVLACHPCHPSVFNTETDMKARFDFFGSGLAAQAVVCALMRGPESDYARGEELVRAMWKPVSRTHRVTVEQMAILEPALSETLAATCLTVIREGMDEAIRRGVPEAAARDFLLGHLFCELGIIFDQTEFPFSDGAKQAIAQAKDVLFKDDWKRIFEPDELQASVRRITQA